MLALDPSILPLTVKLDDIDNQGAADLARSEDEDGLRTIGLYHAYYDIR